MCKQVDDKKETELLKTSEDFDEELIPIFSRSIFPYNAELDFLIHSPRFARISLIKPVEMSTSVESIVDNGICSAVDNPISLPTRDSKKRLRVEDIHDTEDIDDATTKKSSKLSEGAVPCNDTKEIRTKSITYTDSDAQSLKHPFKIYTIEKRQPKSVSASGNTLARDDSYDSIIIKFRMKVSDIELLLHPHMMRKNDCEDEAYEDPDNRDDDDGEEVDFDKFEFYHFHQFELEEAEDDPDDDEMAPRPMYWYGQPFPHTQILKDFIPEQQKKASMVIASSVIPTEDAWLKLHAVKDIKMDLNTETCEIKSIVCPVSSDGAVKFRLAFTDGEVTEHMAVCALEQVLRQPAPTSLKQILKPYLESQQFNCAEMWKRFRHIYRKKDNLELRVDDILIGDLIPFDNDCQNSPAIENVLVRLKRNGLYRVKIIRNELEDALDGDVSDDEDENVKSLYA